MLGFRSFSSSEHADYRFGFNGMEKDDEVKGIGNHYTSMFRQSDPRTGRWFSIDPKTRSFSWQSPYVSMDNRPIAFNDPNGDCPICPALVGGAIGGGLDILVQTAEIGLSEDKSYKEDFSWSSVGISTVAGASGAGLATKIGKLGTFGKLAFEFTMDVAFSTAHQAATLEVGEEFNFVEVGTDVVIGQIVGNQVGNYVEDLAKKSDAAKVLTNQLDRAKRVAGDNPRPSRAVAVYDANQALESYVKSRVVAASVSSSGVASSAVSGGAEVLESMGGSNLESYPLTDF